MWGGELLKDHRIPECYGAWEPTAIYVPLEVDRKRPFLL